VVLLAERATKPWAIPAKPHSGGRLRVNCIVEPLIRGIYPAFRGSPRISSRKRATTALAVNVDTALSV